MGVEPLTHVHLDRERLLAGDQPPPGHQARAREPKADDRGDEKPELACVVRCDRLVDDVLRHPDERDLCALRPDREHDGDDE
jgi:hypothetical protein